MLFNCIYRYPMDKWEADELKSDAKSQVGILEQEYDYAHQGRQFSITVEAENKSSAVSNAKMAIIDIINHNIKGLEELRTIILTSNCEFYRK